MSDPLDRWSPRLSDYLDGDLDPAKTAALEAHLEGCAACRQTLAELGAVVRRAAALESSAPEEDLWPGIAVRLAAPAPVAVAGGRFRWRSRRWSLSLPQLAAAGVLIALVSSAAVWLALAPRGRPGAPAGPAPVARSAAPVPATQLAGFEVQRYDAAIAELEGVLREHRRELDPATVRIIEQNLRTIDRATEQARRALAADPASPYLNGHLAAQLKLKVDVLRQATALVVTHG